jgi:hypothetical protein
LSERSYGGIGFDSDGILSGLIKAKADVQRYNKFYNICNYFLFFKSYEILSWGFSKQHPWAFDGF